MFFSSLFIVHYDYINCFVFQFFVPISMSFWIIMLLFLKCRSEFVFLVFRKSCKLSAFIVLY